MDEETRKSLKAQGYFDLDEDGKKAHCKKLKEYADKLEAFLDGCTARCEIK